MSWETDKEPIEYLRQRIRYYLHKKAKMSKLMENPRPIKGLSEENVRWGITRSLIRIESRIEQYRKAVEDLETIEEMENKVNEQSGLKT